MKTWNDNGAGGFVGITGTADYSGGHLSIPAGWTLNVPTPQWELSGNPQRYYFAGWTSSPVQHTVVEDSTVTVSYQYGAAAAAVEEVFSLDSLLIDFAPDTAEEVLPGSLRLTLGSHTLTDRAGAVYADLAPETGVGTWVGSLLYAARQLILTQWEADAANAPALVSLSTRLGSDAVTEWTGRTPARPIKSGQFTLSATALDGTQVTATADEQGALSATGILGAMTYRTGIYHVKFGRYVTAAGNEGQPWYDAGSIVEGQVWQPLPVYAATIRVDCTSIAKRAMSADVTGMDAARLPQTGALPVFRDSDLVGIHHEDSVEVASPEAGAALNLGRDTLESVWVLDADGGRVPGDRYTATEAELAAGVIHWADPLVTTGHPLPWTVYHRIWETGVLDDVDPSGRLVLRHGPLHRTFPAGSRVSSLLYAGDVQAQVSVPFTQSVWLADGDGEYWHDEPYGTQPSAAYDYLNWPIEVTNRGVTEKNRVALIFETASTYRCVLENGGQIGHGISIHDDYAPPNPATGAPRFTIRGAAGDSGPFGSGWVPGNVLRFNLEPGTVPAVFVKCLQPGVPVAGADHFRFEFKGSVDRP
jgi:hypothetical protein